LLTAAEDAAGLEADAGLSAPSTGLSEPPYAPLLLDAGVLEATGAADAAAEVAAGELLPKSAVVVIGPS
jgi:hypothetical protein